MAEVPEPVSYSPGLRLRAIRFIDDDTLEYDFEGIETAAETFRLSRSNGNDRGIWVYNFVRLLDQQGSSGASEIDAFLANVQPLADAWLMGQQ